ncbi:MAG: GNAT family N-acetyltransferase [Myxococcales bacterium]|nr:GNAT family N-acetyltransferase [Myxococcales bacterium]
MADADELLEPLEWDSRHFGRRVERTRPGDLDEGALAEALERARARGTRLVYHFRSPAAPLSRDLLDRFGGLRVCTQMRFAKDLGSEPAIAPPDGVRIAPTDQREASDVMREVALVAGETSRFRVDPGIPDERFEALYRLWVDRSFRREIADRVMRVTEADGSEIGFLTVVFHPPEFGQLGIGGLSDRARGRGIGPALFTAAEREIARAGLPRSEVATQRENEPACRLYVSLGYHAILEEDAYHFHLGDAPLSPAQEPDRP